MQEAWELTEEEYYKLGQSGSIGPYNTKEAIDAVGKGTKPIALVDQAQWPDFPGIEDPLTEDKLRWYIHKNGYKDLVVEQDDLSGVTWRVYKDGNWQAVKNYMIAKMYKGSNLMRSYLMGKALGYDLEDIIHFLMKTEDSYNKLKKEALDGKSLRNLSPI